MIEGLQELIAEELEGAENEVIRNRIEWAVDDGFIRRLAHFMDGCEIVSTTGVGFADNKKQKVKEFLISELGADEQALQSEREGRDSGDSQE